MTDTLTPRQREILALIRRRVRETGYPPTRAEIAAAFGFRSVTAAVDHLKALARHGVIELREGTSRGIRLLEPVVGGPGLPVVGRVAAGSPILAEEQIEEHHPVDPDLFHPRAHYLLRVQGDSMRDAGIHDRDLLAVHRTLEAYSGQIVVARLGDEVTVKRLHRPDAAQDWLELLPANPAFPPIRVDLRQTTLIIEGIGVGLLRLGLDHPPQPQRL